MGRANVRFGQDARTRILRGATGLADAVRVTLGPRGRNVLFQDDQGAPRITKDGATVAQQIEFADRYAALGATLIRDVADRMDGAAGDGTSTAAVLAHAILREGLKATASCMSPTCLTFGITRAVDAVIAEIKAQSRPVANDTEIAQIATVSANGDAKIGGLIADAMKAVGRDGTILIEEGQSVGDTLDVITGMNFERGYASRHFVDDEDDPSIELRNPFILFHEDRIDDLAPLLKLLDAVVAAKRPLLIVAGDFGPEAIATMVVNRQQGGLKVAAVRAPGFADWRTSYLDDLAVITGGEVVYAGAGMALENVTLDMLGRAKRVHVTQDRTMFIGGAGSKADVERRATQVRLMANKAASDFERDRLLERLGKLGTGVAVIRIGGVTETEIKEKRDRVDDALFATRAAVQDGLVPGGGVTLLRAARALDALQPANLDERAGIDIVRAALQVPARQIADNAGTDGKIVVGKVMSDNAPSFGYDASRGDYGDLLENGVVDPTRMVCNALTHAASVAGVLVTADVVVNEMPPKVYPRHPFACKCSDHDHHYHDDPNHAHAHGHHHHHH